ncbi:hypothetical protein AOLI_G00285880 [Acnodon oligacanthus]
MLEKAGPLCATATATGNYLQPKRARDISFLRVEREVLLLLRREQGRARSLETNSLWTARRGQTTSSSSSIISSESCSDWFHFVYFFIFLFCFSENLKQFKSNKKGKKVKAIPLK